MNSYFDTCWMMVTWVIVKSGGVWVVVSFSGLGLMVIICGGL